MFRRKIINFGPNACPVTATVHRAYTVFFGCSASVEAQYYFIHGPRSGGPKVKAEERCGTVLFLFMGQRGTVRLVDFIQLREKRKRKRTKRKKRTRELERKKRKREREKEERKRTREREKERETDRDRVQRQRAREREGGEGRDRETERDRDRDRERERERRLFFTVVFG